MFIKQKQIFIQSKQIHILLVIKLIFLLTFIYVHKTTEYVLIPHALGKWTTRDIYQTQYNPETKRITLKTG